MEKTVRKARLYDLGFEIEHQAGLVRQAAAEATAMARSWLEWRGSGFDLYNIGQGVKRCREALDALDLEHKRLLKLLDEQAGLKGGI